MLKWWRKIFSEIPYLLMIKTLRKLGTEVSFFFFNLIKISSKKYRTSFIFYGKRLELHSLVTVARSECYLHRHYKHWTGSLSQNNELRKRNISFGKQRRQLFFADDITYKKYSRDSTKNLGKLAREFRKLLDSSLMYIKSINKWWYTICIDEKN